MFPSTGLNGPRRGVPGLRPASLLWCTFFLYEKGGDSKSLLENPGQWAQCLCSHCLSDDLLSGEHESSTPSLRCLMVKQTPALSVSPAGQLGNFLCSSPSSFCLSHTTPAILKSLHLWVRCFYSAFSLETLNISSHVPVISQPPSPECVSPFKEMRLSESTAV